MDVTHKIALATMGALGLLGIFRPKKREEELTLEGNDLGGSDFDAADWLVEPWTSDKSVGGETSKSWGRLRKLTESSILTLPLPAWAKARRKEGFAIVRDEGNVYALRPPEAARAKEKGLEVLVMGGYHLGASDMEGTYRTALDDVFIGSWLKFSTLPGKELALWPMTKNAADKKAGVVLARMDMDGAMALAKKLGGRVPMLSELQAAIRARETAIIAMSNQPVETMGTREAAIKHDNEARKKFTAMGLLFPDDHITKDGADYYSDAPVFFTKTWCVLDDDPNFKATIKPPMGDARFPSVDYSGKDWGMGKRAPEWGFWTKSKKPQSQDGPPYDDSTLVQGNSKTGYGAHNFGHVDYSMVPCVIRNVGGV